MPEEENTAPETPAEPGAEERADDQLAQEEALRQAQDDALRQAQDDALRQAQDDAAALREQLAAAAARYREAVLAAAPEVPPELVQGHTLEEVDRSLEAARRTVEEVRRRLAAQAAAQRVPAGAPLRGGPELGGLSALEKIKWALSRQP
ncbi:MAG: hypothetical protein HYY02_03615 [Chloroflexi bacterium]|nr:hypothetical protein [Chloroflexota bacterium]